MQHAGTVLQDLECKDPKALIAKTVNHKKVHACFGIFALQPLCIALNLLTIFGGNGKVSDFDLLALHLPVGKIFEFDHPTEPGKFLVIFADKLKVTFALGVGTLYIPGEPAREVTATESKKVVR